MENIQNDLLYNVLTFLEPCDLARLSSTCRKFRDEHEQISELMWWDHLSAKWGFNIEFMKRYFPEMKTSNMRAIYPACSRMVKGISSDHLDIDFEEETMTAHFMGRVGESNRSVQGDLCFPARKEQAVEDTGRSSFIEEMMSFANKMASEFLKECEFPNYALDDAEEADVLRHSVPFARSLCNGDVQFYVKPRFISYYEVHIDDAPSTPGMVDNGFECVAVGLATKSFMKNKRLPGWDNESFGYHGDDGAIFHGQGKQLSEFGPRYGCNDTVGCGLNHKDNSIFYTLNGKMLGTAFTDVPCDVDLYPTVGIDTNCSVSFNFGMQPFKFDLVSYLESIEA
jgi:hypothetical protein